MNSDSNKKIFAPKLENTLIIDFNTTKNAKIFYNSFMPEFKNVISSRTSLEVQQIDSKIKFFIKAKDIKAFRAIINSISQFSYVIDEIIKFTRSS
ncbi:MAG: KEOPS complex subunit Pcc1 [Promethearchaeota archaeon]